MIREKSEGISVKKPGKGFQKRVSVRREGQNVKERGKNRNKAQWDVGRCEPATTVLGTAKRSRKKRIMENVTKEERGKLEKTG